MTYDATVRDPDTGLAFGAAFEYARAQASARGDTGCGCPECVREHRARISEERASARAATNPV